MKYEGFICGYPVSYENNLPLHSGLFLSATYAGVVNALCMIPVHIDREAFLYGMMRLTKGHVNPSIILEVYDDFQKEESETV